MHLAKTKFIKSAVNDVHDIVKLFDCSAYHQHAAYIEWNCGPIEWFDTWEDAEKEFNKWLEMGYTVIERKGK